MIHFRPALPAAVSHPSYSPLWAKHASAMMLFLTLQSLDILTTALILRNGGIEMNPLMHWLMPIFGAFGAMFLCKVAVAAAILRFSRKSWLLRIANLFYGLVCTWNLAMLGLAATHHG